MTKKSKIIFVIVLTVIILLITFYAFLKAFSRKSLPDYNTEITIPGTIDEVIVYRDKYAVPTIYAKNEADLYFAEGYIMAQDRLWQMDLIRRITQGRLSEIFGDKYIETDLLFRALRITEKSAEMIKNQPEEMITMINSFTEGVNYYIQNENLPVEFKILGYKPEEWTPENSLNIIGYIGWDLGTAWSNEILASEIKNIVDEEKAKALFPDFKDDETVFKNFADTVTSDLKNELISKIELIEDLGITPLLASNNWAVSGEKSTTGKPILANDMHLSYNNPGIWYQIHLVIDGELDVTGLAIPGCPPIVCGHNQNIAWGMTNVMLDDADFYIETINPENPHQYKFNGEWKDMIVETEIIKTKDGQEISKEILFTHRGPIISGIKNIEDKVISMRWIGNEPSNDGLALYLLNRANNWDEFKTAIRNFVTISQNIAYADIDGNIGMYCAAGIPVRNGNGSGILNGETDEFDWKGFVPFDSLPYEYNPERGYISSANNKISDDLPYYITQWNYQDYRLKRINEMLEAKEKLSIDDFIEMQTDCKSKLVEMLLPDIIYHASTTDLKDETVKKSIEILAQWDGVLSVESTATTIFEEFYITFAKNLISDDLGDSLTEKVLANKIVTNNIVEYAWENQFSYWCDNDNTDDLTENFPDIVIESYLETIENLKTRLGENPEKWYWGDVHTLTLKHPLSEVKILDFLFNLNRGPYGVGGSYHTVSTSSYRFNEPFDVYNGASHRSIYNTADWDSSLTVIPTGISGQPASKHYCDQTELYISNQYRKDYFSKEKTIENSVYKMIIK